MNRRREPDNERLCTMTIPRIAALSAAVPLFLLGAASPAAADGPMDPDRDPWAAFTMTMTAAEDTEAAGRDGSSTVTLECFPAGGSHLDPRRACGILIQAGGDFEALPVEGDLACLDYWDPVVVTVEGHWFGAAVEFEKLYSNAGCAHAFSDGVFLFPQ
jgi:hypothetical protein